MKMGDDLSDFMEKCTITPQHELHGPISPPSSTTLPLLDKDSTMKLDHDPDHFKKGNPKSVKLTRAFAKLASVLPELQMDKYGRMSGICKEVFRILQHRSQFKLQRFVLSKFDLKCIMLIDPPTKTGQTVPGSGHGSNFITLSSILNDFEMCLKSFLANEHAFIDHNNNHQMQLKLFCLGKTNRFTLKFICNGMYVEIIPALNFVSDVLSRTMKEEFLQEQRQGVLAILKDYPSAPTPTPSETSSSAVDEYRQLLENSLLEIHLDAISQQSDFVQKMLHITRLWESVSIWLDNGENPLPSFNDELMDIITIIAAQREEETYANLSSEAEYSMEGVEGAAAMIVPPTEKPSYLRAFRKYLVSIQLFNHLRINFSKNYMLVLDSACGGTEGPAATQDKEPPYIIGFANPYKNLAAHISESYLLSKLAYAAISLGFSYTDFDTCSSCGSCECEGHQRQRQLENLDFEKFLFNKTIQPNTDGLELFCVIVPYILMHEVPEYITALDKIHHELVQAGLGPPDLKAANFYDLPAYVCQAIESGKFKLPEDKLLPTSLGRTFKLFNLCEPPSDLQPLLSDFQKTEYAQHISEPEELFSQLALYEYIQTLVEPFPKRGIISVETNESLSWMKSIDCKHLGFNIRSVVFEDSPIAFQFLQTLATNVDLMALSLSVGEMARSKTLEPNLMLEHLEKHVLTFLNSSNGLVSLVDWNRDYCGKLDESGQQGGGMKKDKTRRRVRAALCTNGVGNCDHKHYDVTYIVPYTILVDDADKLSGQTGENGHMEQDEKSDTTTATNYAVVSLNW